MLFSGYDRRVVRVTSNGYVLRYGIMCKVRSGKTLKNLTYGYYTLFRLLYANVIIAYVFCSSVHLSKPELDTMSALPIDQALISGDNDYLMDSRYHFKLKKRNLFLFFLFFFLLTII